MGALSHIRVLDLSRVLAGPWCAQNLADLGADVIKVERPGAGDDTRHWGPPFVKDADGNETKESAYFICINRNKRSITIDIAKPEGQEIIRKLVSESDVVIENYKVGDLAKYGLDYESLKKVKPDLIYCSITGFGQTGPFANRPGYDFIVQGTLQPGDVAIYTLRALASPAAGECGLVVTYNSAGTITNKTLKAAVSPPVGSLLTYVDP
jgi:formyl-CoA transferase